MTNSDLVALVDDEDYERLAAFRWRAVEGRRGAWYARRQWTERGADGTRKSMVREMQRDVLDPDMVATRWQISDHVNHDTMDNQRHNLRWRDPTTSMVNTRLYLNNGTGYRGVFYDKQVRKYRAQVAFARVRFSSKGYATAEEAARAYNDLARLHHGEDAQLNIIPGEST